MGYRAIKDGVDPKHLPAIEVLAGGGTHTAAGKAVNLSRQAISRWVRTREWKDAIRECRSGMVSAAAGKLARATKAAIDKLVAICKSGESESNQLAAAKSILDSAVKYREQVENSEEIAEIKEILSTGRAAVEEPEPDANQVGANQAAVDSGEPRE